jgi:hypothetical protein
MIGQRTPGTIAQAWLELVPRSARSSLRRLKFPTIENREVGVLERLGLLPILRLRVHHPDLGVRVVEDLAGRSLHDVGEHGGLVLEQERAEGDGEHAASTRRTTSIVSRGCCVVDRTFGPATGG